MIEVTHKLGGLPMVDPDRVYFADVDNIGIALDAHDELHGMVFRFEIVGDDDETETIALCLTLAAAHALPVDVVKVLSAALAMIAENDAEAMDFAGHLFETASKIALMAGRLGGAEWAEVEDDE